MSVVVLGVVTAREGRRCSRGSGFRFLARESWCAVTGINDNIVIAGHVVTVTQSIW